MEKGENIFLKKTFVAITGASRGLGMSIALQFGTKFPPDSVLVLMARTVEALESVKSEVISLAPNISVLVRQYDQGHSENTDYFKDIFNVILEENNFSQADFEQYMIVHNCATIDDVTKAPFDLSDPTFIRKYYDSNLTGMILLNTSFFQTFSDATKSRVVVNVSSAGARTPVPPLRLYCAGKAARDMFMRVLAIEEPSLRILTFAPGATDTAMMREVEELCTLKSMVEMLKGFRAQGVLTLPDVPACKLVKILEENSFENAVYVESEKIM